MKYRRPLQADFEGMLALQNRNLLAVLTPKEQEDGFLNTAFSLENFRAMDKSIAVIVAVEKDKVRGYLCAATLAFKECFPFPAALIKHANNHVYKGRTLSSYRACIVNPICIDKDYRGSGMFMGLCQAMLPIISREYELALAFVSVKNLRSLHACQKMMTIIDEFAVGEHRFAMLVREL